VTARRIAWGKFINAGQTCVAPDYILVEKRLENDFVKSLSKAVVELYTQDPLSSPYYGRIVNQKHFDRLKNLIEPGKVISGGQMVPAKMQIAPTILKEDGTSKAMQDEIFGPILPVMTADSVAQAISIVNSMEKPLALYVFSQDQELIENVLTKTNSGGVCINDCIVHMSTPYLPFGGVGSSGMGAYHGVFSFETFSHKRSVMVRSLWPDLILRYPPYKLALKWFKILLRYMSH
jgi:acyl-CoA reductase-like NAD-dependent aldehyde dehydrogenase